MRTKREELCARSCGMGLKRRRWGQKEKVRGEGDILWQNVIFVTLTWGKRTEEKGKDSGQ